MNTLLEKIGVSPIDLVEKLDLEYTEPGDGGWLTNAELGYLIDLVEQDISGEVVVI